MTLSRNLIVLLFLLLASPAHAQNFPVEFYAKVTWVTDGDTFKFSADVLDVTVRSICRMELYNAPEMTGPERPQGQRSLEYFMKLIKGKTLRVRTEKKDRYGRWLCQAWLPDDRSVDKLMREHLKNYPRRDIYQRGGH